MPTNENTYNSRVTSEALEAKFRQVFPSQGGAELVDDLYASGVITPVIDFSSVAEGSVLAENLQTAWDFSTTTNAAQNSTVTLVNNTGFWKVSVTGYLNYSAAGSQQVLLYLTDGLSVKSIFQLTDSPNGVNDNFIFNQQDLYIFVNSGQSIVLFATDNARLEGFARQVADLNGNLVNPLGFTFS